MNILLANRFYKVTLLGIVFPFTIAIIMFIFTILFDMGLVVWFNPYKFTYTLLLFLLIFIISFLYLIYILYRYQTSPITRLSKKPTDIFNLTLKELKKAKGIIPKINRLDSTLERVGISEKMLNNAITFISKKEKEKITTIAQRVEADLTQQKDYYELRLAENFPLSVEVLIVKFLKSKTLIDVKEEIKQSRILEVDILPMPKGRGF